MKFGLPAVLLPFILFTGKSVFAQSKQEDSILFRSAILNTVSIYNKQLGDQSPIYNGSHYLAPGVEFKQGSPYFLVDSFTGNSSVVYDKIQFDSLNLLYEDLREFVVSKSSNFQMQLINQRITSFIISGHKFIRLVADSLNTGIEKTGFYEMLYNGRASALKKTSKEIIEEATIGEGVLRHIDTSYQYFIKIGNRYMRVKSKRELLDILKDHQKDIQKFIKKNNLKFRNDKDNTLIQVVRFYDLITN